MAMNGERQNVRCGVDDAKVVLQVARLTDVQLAGFNVAYRSE